MDRSTTDTARAVAAEKSRLRPLCLARRANMSAAERAAAHTAMQEALSSSELFRGAELLCLYYPMRDEPDTLPLWRRSHALGKPVALPVCEEGHTLSFRLMPGYSPSPEYLRPGPYGTTEPTEACPLLPYKFLQVALMLVPGLAFDGAGYRLGYGGGYYDRLFAQLAKEDIHPITVGVCYANCLAPGLPHRAHDVPVRYILTEGGLISTHA